MGRLIMCNGRWRWVTKNTRPAVFHDHDFSQHQNCDNPLTSLASYYSGSHNVKHLSLSTAYTPVVGCRAASAQHAAGMESLGLRALMIETDSRLRDLSIEADMVIRPPS